MNDAKIAEVAFAAQTTSDPAARAHAIRLLADAARSREVLMVALNRAQDPHARGCSRPYMEFDRPCSCGLDALRADVERDVDNAAAKKAFDGAVGRAEPEEFTGPPCDGCGSRDCACVDEVNR